MVDFTNVMEMKVEQDTRFGYILMYAGWGLNTIPTASNRKVT
jgi:hypothetical protein